MKRYVEELNERNALLREVLLMEQEEKEQLKLLTALDLKGSGQFDRQHNEQAIKRNHY
jgi:hypothetical protein